MNSGNRNFLEPSGPLQACNGTALPFYKRYDEHNVLKFIKLGRLRWAGHVMGMEKNDPELKVHCTKQGGNADRRGSPKLRWREVLQEDVSKGWCRNWRINLRAREKWRKFTEEVKSHPGV
jgi:hypothetical protein